MFGTPQGSTNVANGPATGKTVYDANRAKVGMISAYNAQSGYFVAEKGMFFPHDLYIPLASIARSDTSGVYLNLTNEQLKADPYKAPPAPSNVPSAGATNVTKAQNATSAPDAPNAPSVTNAPKTNTGNVSAARSDRVDTPVREHPASSVGRQEGRQEGEEIVLPLREETLTANRTREQIGDVIVHRYVTQEDQTIEAPVTHEVISIEQVAARDVPIGNDTFTEKDVEVPLMGERLTLGKDTHVVVEVHIHKRLVTEQQHATGTVRREQYSVKGNEPDATPRDALPRDRDETAPRDALPRDRDITTPRDPLPRDLDDESTSENLP